MDFGGSVASAQPYIKSATGTKVAKKEVAAAYFEFSQAVCIISLVMDREGQKSRTQRCKVCEER